MILVFSPANYSLTWQEIAQTGNPRIDDQPIDARSGRMGYSINSDPDSNSTAHIVKSIGVSTGRPTDNSGNIGAAELIMEINCLFDCDGLFHLDGNWFRQPETSGYVRFYYEAYHINGTFIRWIEPANNVFYFVRENPIYVSGADDWPINHRDTRMVRFAPVLGDRMYRLFIDIGGDIAASAPNSHASARLSFTLKEIRLDFYPLNWVSHWPGDRH